MDENESTISAQCELRAVVRLDYAILRPNSKSLEAIHEIDQEVHRVGLAELMIKRNERETRPNIPCRIFIARKMMPKFKAYSTILERSVSSCQPIAKSLYFTMLISSLLDQGFVGFF